MTTLCKIAAALGSDKCPQIGHNYTPVYDKIIPRYVGNLLEIGIGSPSVMAHVPGYKPGAGLRMWAEWCRRADIYGVDIDPVCANVSGERIHVQIADATAEDVFPEVSKFDVIIDDGSHRLSDQLSAMDRLLPRLAKGGVYVIEDVRWAMPLVELGQKLGFFAEVKEFPENPMTGDNRLVIFR